MVSALIECLRLLRVWAGRSERRCAATPVQASRQNPPTLARKPFPAFVCKPLLHSEPTQLEPYLTPPTLFLGLLLRFLTLLVRQTALLLWPFAAVPPPRSAPKRTVRRPVPRRPRPADTRSIAPVGH